MEDIKFNKAFVTWGVGQSYIDNCEILAEYLLEYTPYDVVIYYGNGNSPTLTSPRLQKIDLSNLDFYKKGVINNKLQFVITPCITQHSLELYDEIVYLDSDIQVTPNIKDVFNEHTQITDYPLACRYPWYYMTADGKSWIADKIKQNIPYNRQLTPTLGVSCHIANKNCIPFINEWVELTIKLTSKVPFHTPGIHEEAVFNALTWSKGGTKFIPTKFAWSPNPEAILEAEEIYLSPEGKPYHPDGSNPTFLLEKNCWKGMGVSCIPLNKNEFWGLHTIKDPDKVKKAYQYIKENF